MLKKRKGKTFKELIAEAKKNMDLNRMYQLLQQEGMEISKELEKQTLRDKIVRKKRDQNLKERLSDGKKL